MEFDSERNGMYINRGDVNFFEYGRLVEDLGDNVFSIISCDPMYDENEGKYLFSICEVDTHDNWIDHQAVRSFAGTDSDSDAMDYALDILSYYGSQEFGDMGEVLTEEEIIERMDSFDAVFEEEPWH